MNRATFFQGVGVALIAAIVGEVVFSALTLLLGSYSALQLVIATLSLCYILYLLRSSEVRLGRVVTISMWLLVTLLTLWLSPHLLLTVTIHSLMIWLVRALYLHNSLLTALADLGLAVLAVSAALWATLQTGSLAMALWCYFLIQALFVFIPSTLTPPRTAPTVENDHFEQARRAAQAALRKLSASN
ncbi:MAG: hypothetical protein OEZ16_03750 [Chromatiales bacterium]|nr:hypothetical protein [Chromatiales bacterium]